MMKTNVTRVTIAVFVATFMTAIEGTIITTAMPTIVGFFTRDRDHELGFFDLLID